MVDPLYEFKLRWRLRDRLNALTPAIDVAAAVPTTLSALHLYALKRVGLEKLRINRSVLDRIGIHPVRDHYYEPFMSPKHLREALDEPRDLPGLDLHVDRGLALLGRLSAYADEPLVGPMPDHPELEYIPHNGTYGLADAALLYALLRELKPTRFLEVGGGNSTLVSMKALARNRADGHPCEHIVVEPFEMPWLERTGVRIVRSPVQDVQLDMFEKLGSQDVLFVDNSHVIRPQGDVLHVVQRIVPRLAPGVVVHIHDLFTPRDYPPVWVLEQRLLWDEQYLVEAFLTQNEKFECVLPAHHLWTDHRAEYSALRPALAIGGRGTGHQPTAMWLRRKPGAADPLFSSPRAPHSKPS